MRYCRKRKWAKVLQMIEAEPSLGEARLPKNNGGDTTVLHRAIAGRRDGEDRAKIISMVVNKCPSALRIANNFDMLPLHHLCHHYDEIPAAQRDDLIINMIQAYPEALTRQTSFRGMYEGATALHIALAGKILCC